nr:MAG TPA: hypothetical protein [Caudoviricetes sp.]
MIEGQNKGQKAINQYILRYETAFTFPFVSCRVVL